MKLTDKKIIKISLIFVLTGIYLIFMIDYITIRINHNTARSLSNIENSFESEFETINGRVSRIEDYSKDLDQAVVIEENVLYCRMFKGIKADNNTREITIKNREDCFIYDIN